MNRETYMAIHAETEKALRYLIRHSDIYEPFSIKSGYNQYNLIGYIAAVADEKHKEHVRKAYPHALILFTSWDNVELSIRINEELFFEAVSKK